MAQDRFPFFMQEYRDAEKKLEKLDQQLYDTISQPLQFRIRGIFRPRERLQRLMDHVADLGLPQLQLDWHPTNPQLNPLIEAEKAFDTLAPRESASNCERLNQFNDPHIYDQIMSVP